MSGKISAGKVVWTSFFVDVLDVLINFWIMIVTGSVVMVAELFQGVSDLVASGLLLVGLKRPKKEIYFWSFMSAIVMLFIASTLSFYFGLKRFLHPEEIKNIFLAFAILIVNITSNGYAFYLSIKRILKGKNWRMVIKEFKDSKLLITKNTFVLDLMGMGAGVVGLAALVLYQLFGEIRFDGLGAMGIGLVLAILSIDLILNIRRLRKTGERIDL
jgi:divalent metal cation (Fe/Co/Zn/Cd) transporter